MIITSDTLVLPPVQYASRASCMQGYGYPHASYNNGLIAAPGIHILALEGLVLVGNGFIVDHDAWTPIFGHEDLTFFPGYASILFHTGKCGRLIYDLLDAHKSQLTCIKVDTVITVLHYNCKVYGHFLLEIVPRLFVLKEFFKITGGSPPVLAYPTFLPKWIKKYIIEIWPDCNFLDFDVCKEYIAAGTTIVVSGDNLQSHPDIADLFTRFSQPKKSMFKKGETFAGLTSRFPTFGRNSNLELKSRKILLTRPDKHVSIRHLANFAELKMVAITRGFEIVEPSEFGSLKKQAIFFSQCSVVLGEFTSALHNTIFCPRDCFIGCMNYVNHYQESIASVIGHNLNYLISAQGAIPWDANNSYIISEQQFSKLIDDIETRINR
jgi:hypothetical protein